jgi:hypothetical protein
MLSAMLSADEPLKLLQDIQHPETASATRLRLKTEKKTVS